MTQPPLAFGSFRVVRTLAASPVGERLLAIDDRTGAAGVVHVRPGGMGRKRRQAELEAVEAAGGLRGQHVLAIQGWGFWAGSGDRLAWVTDYTGSAAGVLTLRGHAASKGGRLSPSEAATVLEHVWTGVRAAHALGHVQGPIDPDAVLIDQHGRAWLENYGLARRLAGGREDVAMLRKLELVSLGALAVELTTGLRPPMPQRLPDDLPIGLPGWPEVPEAWVERAKSWSEEAIAASISGALRAHDTLPAITGVLRELLGGMKDAEERVTRAAGQAAKEAAKDTARSVFKAVATSVWDLIRGR